GIKSHGNYGVLAAEPAAIADNRSDWQHCERKYLLRFDRGDGVHLPPRTSGKARTAERKRSKRNKYRRVSASGLRTHPTVYAAECVHSGTASQGNRGAGEREPRLLRSRAVGWPRPVRSGRHRTSRSRSSRTATRSVHIRCGNILCEFEDGQNPA